ncbi:MAG: hypothetical protein ACYDBL_03775 [Candidatus Acidiferrales bacterium]
MQKALPSCVRAKQDGAPGKNKATTKAKGETSSRHGRGEPRPYESKDGTTSRTETRITFRAKKCNGARGKPAPTKPKEKDTTLRKEREGWGTRKEQGKNKATTKAKTAPRHALKRE